MDWWTKLAAGSREGCFLDPGALKVDASIVCHEIRCPDLEKGETVWFSVKDMKVRDREQLVNCGEMVNLKSLQLDTVLLIRTWAGKSDRADRVCGELRVTMDWVIRQCNSCLYYTWLLLESPGLDASVASVGMFDGREGDGLEQSLRNGPRLLSSPGACLSIIKTALLPPSGQIMWTDDMAQEAKLQLWPCLLKSHQQHMMLCQAQKCQRQTSDNSGALQEQLRGMQDQLRDTTSSLAAERANVQSVQERLIEEQRSPEVARLREKSAQSDVNEQQLQALKEQQARSLAEIDRLAAESRRSSAEIDRLAGENTRLQEMQRAATAEASGYPDVQARSVAEVERLAEENRRLLAHKASLEDSTDRQRAEMESLRGKLDEVGSEANRKIAAANDLIRDLKRQRDEKNKEIKVNELLRSQQIDLTTSLQTHDVQLQVENSKMDAELALLKERDGQRLAEIEQLHAQVGELEAKRQRSSASEASVEGNSQELIALRQANEEKEAELESLKKSLEDVHEHGKASMGSIAEQVRGLVKSREDFRLKFKKIWVENQQLQDKMAGIEEEHTALVEQRDALMKIVEDLHQACESADPQLQEIGRASIRSVKEFKNLTPRRTATPRNVAPSPRGLM